MKYTRTFGSFTKKYYFRAIMKVSKKIKRIRKRKGFSQSYMAMEMEISQRAYSKIECNQTQLNWKKMNQIATILNIGVWELVNTNEKSSAKNVATQNIDLLQKLINKYEKKIDKLEKENLMLKKIKIT